MERAEIANKNASTKNLESQTNERDTLLDARKRKLESEITALESLHLVRTETASFLRTKNDNYGLYLEAIMGRMDFQNAGVINSIQDKWDDNKAKAYEREHGATLDGLHKEVDRQAQAIEKADAFLRMVDAGNGKVFDKDGNEINPEQVKNLRAATVAGKRVAEAEKAKAEKEIKRIQGLAPLPTAPVSPRGGRRAVSGGGRGTQPPPLGGNRQSLTRPVNPFGGQADVPDAKGEKPSIRHRFTKEQTDQLTRPEKVSKAEFQRLKVKDDMAAARRALAKHKANPAAVAAIRKQWAKDHPGIKL